MRSKFCNQCGASLPQAPQRPVGDEARQSEHRDIAHPITLECREYARFDGRLDEDGNPKLLEVNPNPGWCWDGHLAKMFKIAGNSYRDMLESIIKAAESRIGINGE